MACWGFYLAVFLSFLLLQNPWPTLEELYLFHLRRRDEIVDQVFFYRKLEKAQGSDYTSQSPPLRALRKVSASTKNHGSGSVCFRSHQFLPLRSSGLLWVLPFTSSVLRVCLDAEILPST